MVTGALFSPRGYASLFALRMAENKHQGILVQPPRWHTNSLSKLEEEILVFMGGTNWKSTFAVFCSQSNDLGEICTVSIRFLPYGAMWWFHNLVLCHKTTLLMVALAGIWQSFFHYKESVTLQLILLHLCPGTRTPHWENRLWTSLYSNT